MKESKERQTIIQSGVNYRKGGRIYRWVEYPPESGMKGGYKEYFVPESSKRVDSQHMEVSGHWEGPGYWEEKNEGKIS